MFEARETATERQARLWLIAVGAAADGSVALALVLQHVADMQPCAWCVLQRLIYLVIGSLALVAAFTPRSGARRTWMLLGLAGCAAGLAAALYQHFVAARSDSCALTLADKVIMALQLHELAPWMFVAYAPCNKANLPLLGVPFALWSAALFVALGAGIVIAWRALRSAAAHPFG